MIQGIKLQRGGRQTDKNYSGYIVKYGTLFATGNKIDATYTLAWEESVLPLTLRIDRVSQNGSYLQFILKCGNITYTLVPWHQGYDWGYGGYFTLDLEYIFGLDVLIANKKIIVSQRDDSREWVRFNISCVKWLEPA